MGRILVFLAFACLVGTFVLLYNVNYKPPQSGTIGNSNEPKQGNTRSAKPSPSSRSNQARASERRSHKATKSRRPSKEEMVEPNTAANADQTEPQDSEEASLPRVKDESAPMYSLNSKNSKVLRRLKRGEKLSADVEVIDSEGRWSVVKGQGKSRSGFVRDENIEKPSKGTSAAKTKSAQDQ